MPSSVPQFPYLQSMERLEVEKEVAGRGLKEGRREPDWVPVGHRRCSPPHRCLLGGHRCLPASILRAQDQAPDSFQPFKSRGAANPQPFPHGKQSFPALSSIKGMERGWSRKAWKRPSATRHRQLPGHNPDNRNVAANRFACFYWSAQWGCTKWGPTAVPSPFPLPGHPSAHHFLPQFP